MDLREDLSPVLRAKGLKVTKSRLALLRVLVEEHGPFTLEQIRKKMSGAKCDLVTAYRSLNSFEEEQIVHRCDFGDGVVRYEYRGDQHHHHIICRKCRGVEALDFCIGKKVERLLKKRGYENLSHSLEFFGTCMRCQERQSSAQ